MGTISPTHKIEGVGRQVNNPPRAGHLLVVGAQFKKKKMLAVVAAIIVRMQVQNILRRM